MIEQDVLDQYSKQYNPTKQDKVIFNGYKVGNDDWMGKTTLSSSGCKVYIQDVFVGHNYWSKVVLWHEFCHTWEYFDTGDSNHGIGFFIRIIRKPVKFLAQVPCCFVYVFLKLFK